jgi:3-hydroxymyristoyl/3-hydroxydecanoyl-(acyl carrier protein) dehydratase
MFHDKGVLKNPSVLSPEIVAALTDRLTSGPILPDGAGTALTVDRADLERLLPHRAPMLLLDAVDEVDRRSQSIRGHRHLSASDPGFAGHFPEEPVYPAVLIVEAIGQLALSFLHFADRWIVDVPPDVMPPWVQAVRIHGATFIAPFVPGDTMVLHTHVLETDSTLVAAGQAWKNGTLAAFAVSELYVDEMRSPAPQFDDRPTAHEQAVRPVRRRHGAFGRLPVEPFLD